MPNSISRITFSLQETADALGISRKTLYNSIYSGTCPLHTVKLGGRRLVNVDQLMRLIDTAAPGYTKPILLRHKPASHR